MYKWGKYKQSFLSFCRVFASRLSPLTYTSKLFLKVWALAFIISSSCGELPKCGVLLVEFMGSTKKSNKKYILDTQSFLNLVLK